MKKYLILPLFLLLGFLMPSCGNKPVSKKDLINGLHLNVSAEPMTLDPRKGADFISGTFQFLLFEGLVKLTPDSVAGPAIADKVDISEDGLVYTFHLREARWSNGVPITAYDFSQTWLDMLDPKFPAPNAHLLFPIKNAEKAKLGKARLRDVAINAINYNTLEITLEHPTPYFGELLCFSVFSPVCQHHIQEHPDWASGTGKTFVCNGPYRVAKRSSGKEIILEKNPYYWDKDSVDLEQITVSIVENDSTALNMYLNGELDMLGLPFKGIPSDSIPDLLDKGLVSTTDVPGTTICCFNMDRYPFNNKNIRKAFAYSINRKEIVENITQIGEEPGTNLLPKTLMQEQPEPFFKDGDVKTARKYLQKGLDELNLKIEELPKITLLHASTGIYPKVAQAIQEQWRKALGIHIELAGHEYKVFLDKLGNKDFSISQCVWIAQYHDPMNILDRFRIKENKKNYPGYASQEYKHVIDKSVYHQDKKKRFDTLREALNIINEDVPMTAIYHWKSPYLKKRHVKGLIVEQTGFVTLNKIQIDLENTPRKRPLHAKL